MPCLTAATKTALLARRARLVVSLGIAQDAYDELLATTQKSYRLDTAEGSQSATRVKMSDMGEQIERLERAIASIDQRLRGSGISRINLARYSGGNRC